MIVSYNWLKELVKLNVSPEKLAEEMSLYSVEVETFNKMVKATNLVVGHVLECVDHPNSDHLHVCQVDLGEKKDQIVCGAPNIAAGQKVIVALPGAVLPGGTIKNSTVRGVESNGMICSLQELGIENKYEDAFTSTRLKPIKNIEEMSNMLKQTTTSLVIDKFKIPNDTLNTIEKDTGCIVEIDGNKIGIYKGTINIIYAVKPICSHLGCLLTWNNIDKTWDCPCHGSKFDYTGKNIYDPAIKDLEKYNL